MKVGVLVSGAGTNLQALLDAAREPRYPARIVLVGCNRADVAAIGRAQSAGVPVCLVDRVTVLFQGRVLAEGSKDEVRRDPKVAAIYFGTDDA